MSHATARKPKCALFGAGGHAKALAEAILAARCAAIIGVLDSNSATWGKKLLNIPVLGGDEILTSLLKKGVTHFAVAVGSVGDASARIRLFNLGLNRKLTPLTVIAPSASVSAWSELGPGCQIMAGAIIQTSARLAENVIINSGAIVEHDCEIHAHAHVATGARLCGSVKVGAQSHIGAGATVRQGISIGNNAVIGAGAVVVKDVQDGATVAGVPAEPLRKKR